MAKEHLQGEQLKMFMTPNEIIGSVDDSVDRNDDEDLDQLWEMKESELDNSPDYAKLKESVNEEGVKRPVTLTTNYGGKGTLFMGDGHHRVVAAYQKQEKTGRQQYVPVIYSNNYGETAGSDFDVEHPHGANW